MIQTHGMVTLMQWNPGTADMVKVYRADDLNDWSGLQWHAQNRSDIPSDTPTCGWKGDLCKPTIDNQSTYLALGICVVLVVILLSVVIIIFKKHQYETKLKYILSNTIKWEDIQFLSWGNAILHDSISTLHIDNESYVEAKDMINKDKVTYQGKAVILRWFHDRNVHISDRRVLVEIKTMRDLVHDNVNRFIGVCAERSKACILMAYGYRGSVKDIIRNNDITLTNDFKVSFLSDIACGMAYLHQSSIGPHGTLTSSQCVVDSRWTCKVTGHGFRFDQKGNVNPLSLLWTAPELLRTSDLLDGKSMKMADVYSFSIVAFEVLTRAYPYSYNVPDIVSDDIIKRVKERENPLFRPTLPNDSCLEVWTSLLQETWHENPDDRPTILHVAKRIRSLHKGFNLIDNMIKLLETHTRKLEDRVIEKSQELNSEKSKVEALLQELLPPTVAKLLAVGNYIEPETFENVTVFLSDIVGFTSISSQGKPLDIITMLNDMYTVFDDITHMFDVYKVATIGDAYMVASGVPNRNGNLHAVEICKLSLCLQYAIGTVTIPHMPKSQLQMRVGIHSGPCVAGVVGIKMPRYFLFGETIDIASRMESTGQPMKIQISGSSKQLIENYSNFYLESHREYKIQNNTKIATFWLSSKPEA